MDNSLAGRRPTATPSNVSDADVRPDDANNDDGSDDDDDVDAEEEEANNNNTQETFTQQLTQGNELTQLGLDDDDDDDDAGGMSQSRDCHSPLTPIDPLTVPWGRLMPVGGAAAGPALAAAANANDDGHANATAASSSSECCTTASRPQSSSSAASSSNSSSSSGVVAALSSPSPSPRGPTELLPRLPTTWASCGGSNPRSDMNIIATRSRSPSVVLLNGGGGSTDNHNINKSTTPLALGGNSGNGYNTTQHQQYHSPTPRINFLGLKNLLPSDRFNEYVLGRSIKVRSPLGSSNIIAFHAIP
jgi:hypothetical protein